MSTKSKWLTLTFFIAVNRCLEKDCVSCYSSSMHWEVRPYLRPQEEHEKKIRKGGKATRIAEWRSGSERWGAPAVGPRISLPGPSHLCDDSHPPYRPRPDSESLPHRSWDIEQADATGRPTWKLEGGWGPIVDRTQPLASRLPRLPFSVLSTVSQWQ